MGWNYRVLRFEEPPDGSWYAIHEVYYGDGGEVTGWTEEAANVGSETRDGILPVLAMMCDALSHDVLDGLTGKPIEAKRVLTDELAALLQHAIDSGHIDLSAPPRAE